MQVESRQGYRDPSKAAVAVARPEERADLGHRMQGCRFGTGVSLWNKDMNGSQYQD